MIILRGLAINGGMMAAVRLVVAGCACISPSLAYAEDLSEELKQLDSKIVYETYRDNNWELRTGSPRQ